MVTLLVILLAPLLGAVGSLVAARRGRGAAALASGVPPLVVLAALVAAAPGILGGEVLRVRTAWVPALGLEMAFRLDALGWLFAMLVAGVGLLVVLYAYYYLPVADRLGRFYALLLGFMASMLGIVSSGNLLLLVVFWELTSAISFFLIAYWARGEVSARLGARTALAVTGGGGLALLGGVVLLGQAAGGFDLDVVLGAGDRVRASPLYLPALALILLGAFTKSAQWPFHFWLPAAMAAPTPASAYLHSATMVKAGVFLLARLHPVLAGTDAWVIVVGAAGMVTLLFGAYAALWQHDLKGLLAYSTISHLGLITMLLGFGTGTAVMAAVFHIVNHATFKASLFMAAGIVDHEAGTRDMRRLNGLVRAMPWTAALAVVATAAMAGVPLLNGFLSKEMFFAESLEAPGPGGLRWIGPAAALLYGVMSVAYSARFVMVFFNGALAPATAHEAPRFMRVPIELLVAACVIVGTIPSITIGPALVAATRDTLQAPAPYVSLAIWHGFNLPLAMTLVALVAGIVMYRHRDRLYRMHDQYAPSFSTTIVFARFVKFMERRAARFTESLETGSLSRSTAVLLAVMLVMGATAVATRGGADAGTEVTGPAADVVSIVIWMLLATAAVAAARWHARPLRALIAASVVGLFVALAFVRLSAPDLALTQLLVEVVTILVLLLALHRLPQRTSAPAERHPPARWGRLVSARDLVLAGGVGAGAAALTWTVLRRPVHGGGAISELAAYYLRESKPKGGGTNVVNVILVDFRGFDTLGEITVLACAAIGGAVLLERMRPVDDAPERPYSPDAHPTVLAALTRPFLPFALMLAAFLFLRGHDLPGGGFIAGLLAAVALASQYLTSGIEWTTERLRIDARRWLAAGVLLAAAVGAGAFLFGRPFLTSFYGYAYVPLIGAVGAGSAFLFDLGVALAVFGAVLLMLERLGLIGRVRDVGGTTPAAEVPADEAAAIPPAVDR